MALTGPRESKLNNKKKNDIFVLQICENVNANSIVLFFSDPHYSLILSNIHSHILSQTDKAACQKQVALDSGEHIFLVNPISQSFPGDILAVP